MDLTSGGFNRKNGAWNTWGMMDMGDLKDPWPFTTGSGGV